MKKVFIAALSGGVLVGCLLGAPTANASVTQFQTLAQEKMPYLVSKYCMPALLQEGYKVCQYEAQGTTGASDLADLIIADMSMSRDAAITLEVIAEHTLGC
jgi:hypothetical protein